MLEATLFLCLRGSEKHGIYLETQKDLGCFVDFGCGYRYFIYYLWWRGRGRTCDERQGGAEAYQLIF